MRELIAITISFQSSIPQIRSQLKKKNPHQKHIPPVFTDVRHRRNTSEGPSVTHAINPDAEDVVGRLDEQLVLRKPFL